MKHFLRSCDTPNWACILMFLLVYMAGVLQEKLESLRRERYEQLTGEEHP